MMHAASSSTTMFAYRLAKVLPPRESQDVTTRVGSSYGGNHSLEWVEAPRNILIITKTNDDKTQQAMQRIIE
jgi:NADH kinase